MHSIVRMNDRKHETENEEFGSTSPLQSPDDFDADGSPLGGKPSREEGFGSTARNENPDDQEEEQLED